MNEPVTKELVIHKIKHNLRRLRTAIKWIIFSILSGLLIGMVGIAFLLWHDMGHRYKNCLSMAHLLSSAGWNHDYTALSSSP